MVGALFLIDGRHSMDGGMRRPRRPPFTPLGSHRDRHISRIIPPHCVPDHALPTSFPLPSLSSTSISTICNPCTPSSYLRHTSASYPSLTFCAKSSSLHRLATYSSKVSFPVLSHAQAALYALPELRRGALVGVLSTTRELRGMCLSQRGA